MASPRHDLGREPWHNPHGLLPRWASSSRPPGRGQSADCLAFASGCENSLLPDCPRDHVGSNKWARAGRCRGHPCDPKQGAGGVLRRRLGAVPHSVRPRLMAGAVATTAWRRTPCSRSRLGGGAWNLGAATSMTSCKESAFGAAWSVIEDRSPLFARRLLRPAELPEQIAIARRSLAYSARKRLRRATTRPNEIQHIDPPARRRRPIPFVR